MKPLYYNMFVDISKYTVIGMSSYLTLKVISQNDISNKDAVTISFITVFTAFLTDTIIK